MSNTYAVNTRQRAGIKFQNDSIELNVPQTIKALENKYHATGSRVDTVATISYPGHSFLAGDSAVLEGTAPFNGTYTIDSVTENSFNITVADAGAESDDNINVVRTEVHVNEYVGPNALVCKYIITQTIAELLALFTPGTAIQATIISGFIQNNELVAASAGKTALFFTSKIIEMSKKVYDTLTFTDMDRALTVVTVTCAAHGLKVGDYITVDSSNNALDGTFAVASVPTANTFTYATAASGSISDATGTGYRQATFLKTYESGAQNVQYILNELYSSLIASAAYTPWYSPISAQQALEGPGAINITSYLTSLTTTGAAPNAFTLADGSLGQVKKIVLGVDDGDAVITPSNLAGGTTITMDTAAEYVILQFNGTDWVVIENSGAVIA